MLVRADGSYLYSFTSVVDDIAFAITHVIRGEDHVTNSGAQIQMFRALDAREPVFAHLPLLVDAAGGGLSKRTGSLSVGELRERGIEALAISRAAGAARHRRSGRAGDVARRLWSRPSISRASAVPRRASRKRSWRI